MYILETKLVILHQNVASNIISKIESYSKNGTIFIIREKKSLKKGMWQFFQNICWDVSF